jgi:hypothetical protein
MSCKGSVGIYPQDIFLCLYRGHVNLHFTSQQLIFDWNKRWQICVNYVSIKCLGKLQWSAGQWDKPHVVLWYDIKILKMIRNHCASVKRPKAIRTIKRATNDNLQILHICTSSFLQHRTDTKLLACCSPWAVGWSLCYWSFHSGARLNGHKTSVTRSHLGDPVNKID